MKTFIAVTNNRPVPVPGASRLPNAQRKPAHYWLVWSCREPHVESFNTDIVLNKTVNGDGRLFLRGSDGVLHMYVLTT